MRLSADECLQSEELSAQDQRLQTVEMRFASSQWFTGQERNETQVNYSKVNASTEGTDEQDGVWLVDERRGRKAGSLLPLAL